MMSNVQSQSPHASHSTRLNWLATVVGGIPFFPFYALVLTFPLASLVGDVGQVTNLLLPLYVPVFFVDAVFFSNVNTYLLVSIIGLLVGIAALIWGHPGRLARAWSLLLVLSIVAFPLVYRYQPALGAAPGCEMQVVTQPGLFDSVVKAAHIAAEKCPCEYQLLGWDLDQQLYYQATCDTETTWWQYDPGSGAGPRQVSSVPAALSQESVSRNTVLEMVRAHGVRPADAEPATRPVLLREAGYISPDGRWTAIVTQHVYGPQDVILLTPFK